MKTFELKKTGFCLNIEIIFICIFDILHSYLLHLICLIIKSNIHILFNKFLFHLHSNSILDACDHYIVQII